MGETMKNLAEQVKTLSPRMDEEFLELGTVLDQLQHEDPTVYRDAVKASGLGSRKVYYLLDIARAFRGLDVEKDQLIRVGWTKLGMLAKKVNPHNVDKLLAEAEQLTVRQLADLLRGDQPEADTRTMMLTFAASDYSLLDIALRKHGAQRSGRGLVDKELAILNLVKMVNAQTTTISDLQDEIAVLKARVKKA